jgi:hypothetical protein
MVSGILWRIGIGVVAATVLAGVVGLFLPRTFVVEKSLVIKASPERIHEFTSDLEQWPVWVPWLTEGPELVMTLGDTTSGVGASQTWQDGSTGGRLLITFSDPAAGIAYEMTFAKKTYKAVGRLGYRMAPGGTEVVWHLTGDNGNNILARYFAGLMPSFIGPQLAEGLARLKLVCEKSTLEPGPVSAN